jgi:hypothetical protein
MDDDPSHQVQFISDELRAMRSEDSWTVEEIVTFTTADGDEIVGKVAAGPYTSKGVIKYVVIDDEDSDMIVAGSLFDQ